VKASLETFGITDRSAAFKTAKEMAESPDPIQRRGAAFALAALGDTGAVPLLLTLLNDEDATVREAATNALQRIGGPTPR
jgi:HEAT repeat protein